MQEKLEKRIVRTTKMVVLYYKDHSRFVPKKWQSRITISC
jgi:hypothetical protein